MKTQENDGTEIVPNAELQLIIKANALPDDLGNVIQEKFSGAFAQLDEWKTKADALVITSEDQVQEIALANDGRKTLMKIRTTLEKTRVELKAPYLNMGRAIDAVCKALTERIAPIEEDLKTKAEYAVNLAAERKARLVAERRAALIEVGHSGDMPNLGELPEDTFQMLLVGARAQAQQVKEQAEREAAELAAAQEAERLEAERVANAEKTLNERILRLVEIGAKRNNDPNPYLFIGAVLIYVESLGVIQDESFELLVDEFKNEAQRLAAEEAEKDARKDRFQGRVKTLIALGAKEITDGENDRLELGNSKVMLDALYSLNEEDERWAFTLQSFQDEAMRLKQLADQVALQERERLQTANDRLAALRDVGFATTFEAVADLTDVEFDALLKVKTTEHNAQKERQRIANLGLMRKPLLDAQGEIRSAEFLGGLTNDEFQALLDNATRLKQQADQDRANEAAQAAIEAQRKADEAAKLKADEIARKKAESATDKEKLEEMVKQIQAIVMPTCTSIQGDAIARGAIERLGKLVGHMHEAMQQM